MSEQENEKQLNVPISPFGEMTEGAIGMHEMYKSYVEAGFTRWEALDLIARILVYSGHEHNPPVE